VIPLILTALCALGALWCARSTARYRRQAEESARRAQAATEQARAALDAMKET